ncbi:ABC transporter permease subunit [Nordella sp. HKS 07]|uniref:ABC transporter permease n=1 Tax=Nordella sp. HKS 07 TaxID=2712222 RepID=UPI0013E1C109|nr:ABC transporter permease subunit [Nordella sp. HKS 07]QIG48701.1 ABC transporter permease subunit [Nordella sp. HKS 07]
MTFIAATKLAARQEPRWRDLLGHPATLWLLSAMIVFGAWEIAGRWPISPAFPPFSDTMAALAGLIADGSLAKALLITLEPLAIGLIASVLVGVGLGVLMGLNRLAEWLCSPVFVIAQSAPLAALIPILTFAYGIGLTAKVLTVCIMAMPVIVLNSLNAVRHTPESLIDMGHAFLASRRQMVLKIILPAASLMIFAGLRLGCAAGFIGVVLAELLITPTGIGDIITYNQSVAEYEKMYAAIFAIIALSVLFISLLEIVETTLFRPEKRAQS